MATFTSAYVTALIDMGGSYMTDESDPIVQISTDADGNSFESGTPITVTADGGGGAYQVDYVGSYGDGYIGLFNGQAFLFSNTPVPEFSTITADPAPFVTCFMAGTLIATPAGPRAIETLASGNAVLTATGEVRAIGWVGRQTVVPAFVPMLRSWPVRILAGALGQDMPARDLFVAPDHALLVGGVLVQAGALVNGVSVIRILTPPASFTYYHVEVADHALILAEGVPAETFVDNVSRRRFDNYAEYEARFGAEETATGELDMPRIKSARQLPNAVRELLASRIKALALDIEAA